MLRVKTILFLFAMLFASVSLKAGGFVAYSMASIFDVPGDTSYLELDFKVPASSLKFTLADIEKYTAKLNVYIGIYHDDKAVYADKYILTSPALENKTHINFNILDAKRIKLLPGNYILELFLQDGNDTSQHAFVRKEVQMPLLKSNIHFSDIIMLDTVYQSSEAGVFTRFNYNMLPAVVNLVPASGNNLFFYTEIYNSQLVAKNGLVQIHYSIKNNKSDSIIRKYTRIKTKTAAPVIYLFDGIDVKSLPSGEYFLKLEILDDSQKVIASQVMPFIRWKKLELIANDYSHMPANAFVDSLKFKYVTDFYKYLYAIEKMDEYDKFSSLQSKNDSVGIKVWFYKFWVARDPYNPYKAYIDYKKLVEYCQENYKSPVGPGYKTDRGRICLRYGVPDHVVSSEDEPSAYQYQIWRYNDALNQSNIHFVFYNPTQMPNDFVLLNSDAIGETHNPLWKKFIYKRTTTNTNMNQNVIPKNFGDQLDMRMAE